MAGVPFGNDCISLLEAFISQTAEASNSNFDTDAVSKSELHWALWLAWEEQRARAYEPAR